MPELTDGLKVTWEPHRWEMTGPLSRRQRAKAAGDYLAAVPARIGDLTFSLDAELAAEVDDARDAIARFDGDVSDGLPGELGPMSAVLLRTESASSSQIEHITAGAKALALAELSGARGRGRIASTNATLVAANVDAMRRAVALAERISPRTILDIHEALMRGQPHADPGRFRQQQVWIGVGPTPHGADFVAPHHERIAAAVEELCEFSERTDLPVLAHVALAHAQFETIHPFNDGNGRTGRALVQAMLRRAGATTRVTLPVSAGLLTDTDGYVRALTAYREGDANPIVARFVAATFAAVANGRTLARDLQTVRAEWDSRLTVRRDAAARQLLPLLVAHPAVTSTLVQELLGVSQPTADSAVRVLIEAGVLSPTSTGQRYRAYVAPEVLTALDDFASRARRR